MERFNDVLNRIYNKDFRDMEPDGITYGIRTNSPVPGREGAVERSGTSATSTVESTTTEVQNAVNTAAMVMQMLLLNLLHKLLLVVGLDLVLVPIVISKLHKFSKL